MVFNEQEIVTADHIQKAVAALKAERPAYAEFLDFYGKLFLAQETAKRQTHIEPIQIADELLSIKRRDAFPLIERTGFSIDVEASQALLKNLCSMAAETNEVLAQVGVRVLEALDKGMLQAPTLFQEILREEGGSFEEVAQELDVDEKILAFLTYSSIRPSLSLSAEQLATYLNKETPWQKGYCPVCGGLPSLSILRDEGKRFLLCSFCGHEWETRRIYCPFCDNQDHRQLRYFFSEEEKNYRVDVCDACKKYLKGIDTRQIKHPVYLLMEQVSTLHLDVLAQEQGFESGSPLWLRI
ncbi:MAG: formate dehydrogenase accessory protein FdhE [Deltaproteobacteria bacterium]